MDGPAGYCAPCDRADRERQIPRDLSSAWTLNNRTSERRKQRQRQREDTHGFQNLLRTGRSHEEMKGAFARLTRHAQVKGTVGGSRSLRTLLVTVVTLQPRSRGRGQPSASTRSPAPSPCVLCRSHGTAWRAAAGASRGPPTSAEVRDTWVASVSFAAEDTEAPSWP